MVKNTINSDWTNYIQKQIERKVPLKTLEEKLIKQNYSREIIDNLLYNSNKATTQQVGINNNENSQNNSENSENVSLKYTGIKQTEPNFSLLESHQTSQKLNSDPSVYIVNNFLTNSECEHIIKISKKKLKPSLVSGDKKGFSSKGRTSYNCWIKHDYDNIFYKIALTISNLVNIPLENAEQFQVIYYDKDAEYRPHYDGWEHNKSEKTLRSMKYGGQRLVTALCYLNNIEEGGSTQFTKLKLDVNSEKGKLLIFKNVYSDTNIRHKNSIHAGMPVIKGEKYAFNLWFREHSYTELYEHHNPDYYK